MPRRHRLVAAIALGAGLAVAGATPAFAHVAIEPERAEQGAPTTLTFSVPNEKPAASTVRIDIQLPAGVRGVTATAKDGWTAQITQASESTPGEVIWSGGQFGGDTREEFVLQVEAMPATGDEAQFKTVQTYSTGEEVAWIQPPNPDGSEPDRPTPAVQLTPSTTPSTAQPTATTSSTTQPTSTSTTSSSSSAPAGSTSDDSNAPLLIAIVLVGAATIAAVAVLVRRGRRTP